MDRAENNDVYNLIMHYRVDVIQAPLHKKTRPTKKKKKKKIRIVKQPFSQSARCWRQKVVSRSVSQSVNQLGSVKRIDQSANQ